MSRTSLDWLSSAAAGIWHGHPKSTNSKANRRSLIFLIILSQQKAHLKRESRSSQRDFQMSQGNRLSIFRILNRIGGGGAVWSTTPEFQGRRSDQASGSLQAGLATGRPQCSVPEQGSVTAKHKHFPSATNAGLNNPTGSKQPGLPYQYHRRCRRRPYSSRESHFCPGSASPGK
jgi:hypothetical protein